MDDILTRYEIRVDDIVMCKSGLPCVIIHTAHPDCAVEFIKQQATHHESDATSYSMWERNGCAVFNGVFSESNDKVKIKSGIFKRFSRDYIPCWLMFSDYLNREDTCKVFGAIAVKTFLEVVQKNTNNNLALHMCNGFIKVIEVPTNTSKEVTNNA